RPRAPDVAREGVSEQVLSCTVKLELLCEISAFNEGVPGQLVDLLVILPALVRHNQEHVVATMRRVAVDQQAGLLRRVQLSLAERQDVWVRRRVAYHTANVCLDN